MRNTKHSVLRILRNPIIELVIMTVVTSVTLKRLEKIKRNEQWMLLLIWSSVILFKGRLCLANPFFFNCNNDNCSFVLDDFQGLISYFVLLTFPLPLNPKVLCFVTSIVIVRFQLPIFPFWNIKSLCSSFSCVSLEALSFLSWLSWKVFSTDFQLWNHHETQCLFTDSPFGSVTVKQSFFS